MHRRTGRFWTGFARLPEEVQRVARHNFAHPGRIPRTPRCISKKLEIFGRQDRAPSSCARGGGRQRLHLGVDWSSRRVQATDQTSELTARSGVRLRDRKLAPSVRFGPRRWVPSASRKRASARCAPWSLHILESASRLWRGPRPRSRGLPGVAGF